MASYGERKLHDLVRRLLFASEQGSVDWQTTDREHAFRTSVGKTPIVVASQDDDGAFPWTLQIMDTQGDVVDSLTSQTTTVRDATGRLTKRASEWNGDLRNLYEMARRKALNIDVVVDELLSQLPAPPPEEPPF